MSDQSYNTIPGITASSLKAGRLSMAHMRFQMLRPRDSGGETPAMRMGTLAHMALLEPLRCVSECVIFCGNKTKQPKEWKEFKAENKGRQIVTRAEMDMLTGMSKASKADKSVRRALADVKETEKAITWNDKNYGVAKARLDGFGVGTLLEYKTTKNIERAAFMRQCEGLGYHIQLGWYWHGCGRPADVFMVAQEKTEPYCCGVFRVPHVTLELAYEEADSLARKYRICEGLNVFPGPYDSIVDYERPGYAGPDMDDDD